MKIFGWLVLLLIAIPVAWLGSAFVYETANGYVHRFRLAVEVDTPDGPKRGWSVWQSAWTRKAGWIPQTGGALSSLRGDAVFVDLGQGRNVIAILGFGPTGGDYGIESLAARAFGRDKPLWFVDAPNWTGAAELKLSDVPTLVTFGNLSDPATARVVQPEAFEQAFGAGFRFRRATIEMVPVGIWPLNLIGLSGVPITRGIEARLAWISRISGYLNGKFACNPSIETCLEVGHFRRK